MAALKKLGVPLLRQVLRSGTCDSLPMLSAGIRVNVVLRRNVSDEPYAPELPPVAGIYVYDMTPFS